MGKGYASKKAGILSYISWVLLILWFIIYSFDLLKTFTSNDYSVVKTVFLYSLPAVIAFVVSLFSRKLEGSRLINTLSLVISILIILFLLFIMFIASFLVN